MTSNVPKGFNGINDIINENTTLDAAIQEAKDEKKLSTNNDHTHKFASNDEESLYVHKKEDNEDVDDVDDEYEEEDDDEDEDDDDNDDDEYDEDEEDDDDNDDDDDDDDVDEDEIDNNSFHSHFWKIIFSSIVIYIVFTVLTSLLDQIY